MTKKLSITFEQHVFPLVQVSANPSYQRTQQQVEANLTSLISATAVRNEPNRFLVELRVSLDATEKTDLPYSLDVVCFSFMNVEEGPEAEQKKAATELGHSFLFPAIRELVLTITARQPWGPFSIGFSSLDDEPAQEAAPPAPPRRVAPRRIRKPKPELKT